MIDRLVRMQHYSLPTRLLDVTWNPLVALYFCVKSNHDQDGEVVILGVDKQDDKFFDSDTVACTSNLAYLKPEERNALRLGLRKSIPEFNKMGEAGRLLHFIKAEKPYFEPCIRPGDLARNLFVRPKHNNRRITAQNGAFLLFGLQHKPLEEKKQRYTINRLKIEAASKKQLSQELDLFGFNDETMFPELERASIYITGKFS